MFDQISFIYSWSNISQIFNFPWHATLITMEYNLLMDGDIGDVADKENLVKWMTYNQIVLLPKVLINSIRKLTHI